MTSKCAFLSHGVRKGRRGIVSKKKKKKSSCSIPHTIWCPNALIGPFAKLIPMICHDYKIPLTQQMGGNMLNSMGKKKRFFIRFDWKIVLFPLFLFLNPLIISA